MRPFVPKAKAKAKATLALAALLLLLSGCAATARFDVGRSETVLPLSRAWVDGRLVEYVTTDISDAGMARMMGANHVPRLAEAIRPAAPGAALVERVYKFAGDTQLSIFASAPQPAGPDNADRGYSPLWRVVQVRWRHPAAARELRSEEALLAAEDRQEVSLTLTDIVVNCPVTRDVNGLALKGVR